MIRFGLIRHAKTPWNLEKKIQGTSDIALSSEGISQAGLFAEALRSKKYELILSSPMIRARQTAEIIRDKIHVDVEYEPDFREQDFGLWEGKKLVDIRGQSPGEIERQESRGWGFCPPGGESRIKVLKRVQRAMDQAVKTFNKQQVLIVTHQSVMKILIYDILGRSFSSREKSLLKGYHLHELTWDKKLFIEKLNSMKI